MLCGVPRLAGRRGAEIDLMDRRLRMLGHVAWLRRRDRGPAGHETGAPGDDRPRLALDATARADAQSAAAAARRHLDRDDDPEGGAPPA
jgi:hypothetical protein